MSGIVHSSSLNIYEHFKGKCEADGVFKTTSDNGTFNGKITVLEFSGSWYIPKIDRTGSFSGKKK